MTHKSAPMSGVVASAACISYVVFVEHGEYELQEQIVSTRMLTDESLSVCRV